MLAAAKGVRSMIVELVIRFIVGGLVVSAFALISDVLRPKTFAGIFSAAPSVALATLGLTLLLKGGAYAGVEGNAMMAGAAAMLVFSMLSGAALIRRTGNALAVASSAGAAWLVVAFVLWGAFIR
jgi:Protein of unknown function (DUF3147)